MLNLNSEVLHWLGACEEGRRWFSETYGKKTVPIDTIFRDLEKQDVFTGRREWANWLFTHAHVPGRFSPRIPSSTLDWKGEYALYIPGNLELDVDVETSRPIYALGSITGSHGLKADSINCPGALNCDYLAANHVNCAQGVHAKRIDVRRTVRCKNGPIVAREGIIVRGEDENEIVCASIRCMSGDIDCNGDIFCSIGDIYARGKVRIIRKAYVPFGAISAAELELSGVVVVDDYAQTHRGRCPLPNGAIRLPTTHVYPPPHTAGCGIT